MRRLFLALLLLCLSAHAWAQTGTIHQVRHVHDLPPASTKTGETWQVLDALNASDCALGGGTYQNFCQSNGATWAATTGGTGGAIFGPSGPSHAPGLAPDPGAVAGTGRFLREDAQWRPPVTDTEVDSTDPVICGNPLRLQTCVTNIGTNVRTLVIRGDLTYSTTTVPNTITLDFRRGPGRLVRSGSAVATLQGKILAGDDQNIFNDCNGGISFVGNTVVAQVSVKWCAGGSGTVGVKGDAQVVGTYGTMAAAGGAITSGTNTLTILTGQQGFAATDMGRMIKVEGAGASNTDLIAYVCTTTGFVNATTVNLCTTLGGAVAQNAGTTCISCRVVWYTNMKDGGTIAAAGSALTIPATSSSLFAATDVGKAITIEGAGVVSSGVAGNMTAFICASGGFVSTTAVNLCTTATGAVAATATTACNGNCIVKWGTDDRGNINFATVMLHGLNKILYFPPGQYYLSGGLTFQASNITYAGSTSGASVLMAGGAATNIFVGGTNIIRSDISIRDLGFWARPAQSGPVIDCDGQIVNQVFIARIRTNLSRTTAPGVGLKCRDTTVRDSYFYSLAPDSVAPTGITVNSGAENFTIINNWCQTTRTCVNGGVSTANYGYRTGTYDGNFAEGMYPYLPAVPNGRGPVTSATYGANSLDDPGAIFTTLGVVTAWRVRALAKQVVGTPIASVNPLGQWAGFSTVGAGGLQVTDQSTRTIASNGAVRVNATSKVTLTLTATPTFRAGDLIYVRNAGNSSFNGGPFTVDAGVDYTNKKITYTQAGADLTASGGTVSLVDFGITNPVVVNDLIQTNAKFCPVRGTISQGVVSCEKWYDRFTLNPVDPPSSSRTIVATVNGGVVRDGANDVTVTTTTDATFVLGEELFLAGTDSAAFDGPCLVTAVTTARILHCQQVGAAGSSQNGTVMPAYRYLTWVIGTVDSGATSGGAGTPITATHLSIRQWQNYNGVPSTPATGTPYEVVNVQGYSSSAYTLTGTDPMVENIRVTRNHASRHFGDQYFIQGGRSRGVLVEGNISVDGGDACGTFWGDNLTITNNKFMHCGGGCINLLALTTAPGSQFLFSSNTIVDCAWSALPAAFGTAIEIDSVPNSIISNNIIAIVDNDPAAAGYGIELGLNASLAGLEMHTLIANNQILNMKNGGIYVFAGVPDTEIRNNTIVQTQGMGIIDRGTRTRSIGNKVSVDPAGTALCDQGTGGFWQANYVPAGLLKTGASGTTCATAITASTAQWQGNYKAMGPPTTGAFVLTGGGGWGSGAGITNITGHDRSLAFRVTAAGATPAPGLAPTIVFTYPNLITGIAPLYTVLMRSNSGGTACNGFTWSASTTALTITCPGTPVAGETYDFQATTTD